VFQFNLIYFIIISYSASAVKIFNARTSKLVMQATLRNMVVNRIRYWLMTSRIGSYMTDMRQRDPTNVGCQCRPSLLAFASWLFRVYFL